MALLAPLLAVGLALSLATPAHATYILKRADHSALGNTLTVVYQEDSDGHGFKLQSVRITDGGGGDGQGSAGRGIKCWNDSAVVKWQKDDAATTLDRGESKIWYPDQTWTTATEMHCRWDFTKVYLVGGNVEDYIKIDLT
jgi:hypothetical protein